jgi:hypothetical protein
MPALPVRDKTVAQAAASITLISNRSNFQLFRFRLAASGFCTPNPEAATTANSASGTERRLARAFREAATAVETISAARAPLRNYIARGAPLAGVADASTFESG